MLVQIENVFYNLVAARAITIDVTSAGYHLIIDFDGNPNNHVKLFADAILFEEDKRDIIEKVLAYCQKNQV